MVGISSRGGHLLHQPGDEGQVTASSEESDRGNGADVVVVLLHSPNRNGGVVKGGV